MKKIGILITLLFTCGFAGAQTRWANQTKFKGTIGTYKIVMTLAEPYGGATPCFTAGEYYYLSIKKDITLCSEDNEKILERVDGKITGYFILNNWNKNIGQTVVGTWYSKDGKKSLPVYLKVIGKLDD